MASHERFYRRYEIAEVVVASTLWLDFCFWSGEKLSRIRRVELQMTRSFLPEEG